MYPLVYCVLLVLLVSPTPPPTHPQSLRPSSQLLGQVAKVLKLAKVHEVVFALGLTTSSDPELKACGRPHPLILNAVFIVIYVGGANVYCMCGLHGIMLTTVCTYSLGHEVVNL